MHTPASTGRGRHISSRQTSPSTFTTERGVKALAAPCTRPCFAILTRQGFRSVYAGVTLPNEASIGLHEAMGFRSVGVYGNVGHTLGRWHDVGWWALTLQETDAPPALISFANLEHQIDP